MEVLKKSMPSDDTMQIQTTQFSSYEKTEWNHDASKSISLGFETTISTEFSSANRETIEKILSHVAASSSFDDVAPENLRMYASPEKIKIATENCLGIAVMNARARATTIAASEGTQLGAMISAEYGEAANESAPSPMPRVMAMAKSMDVNLASKDAEISVAVRATFATR
jgi:hypothetical protein